MIQDILQQVIEAIRAVDESIGDTTIPPSPPECLEGGVPTLEKDFYRPLTPMLEVRFKQFGSWRHATHGNWLSLQEMETLWGDPLDAKIAGIKQMLMIHSKDWANDAISLFKPERISVFAGDDEGNERLYLLWFDFVAEPEIWVYDTNGEAHYKDLEAYLKAYLEDDLMAYDKHWILEYPSA